MGRRSDSLVSCGWVIYNIVDVTSAQLLWKKLEGLYTKKPLQNRLYLKQGLYTFYMKEGTQFVIIPLNATK